MLTEADTPEITSAYAAPTVSEPTTAAPAKPQRGRKTGSGGGNGIKSKGKSSDLCLVLNADGTYREFDPDDMLAEAATSFGNSEIRIVRGIVLDFEIKEK